DGGSGVAGPAVVEVRRARREAAQRRHAELREVSKNAVTAPAHVADPAGDRWVGVLLGDGQDRERWVAVRLVSRTDVHPANQRAGADVWRGVAAAVNCGATG